ncbi:MAG: RDD family protein [Luteimonas sp.]
MTPHPAKALLAAGCWRRTAAWLLDASAVGAIATVMAWPAIHAGWPTAHAAAKLLSERTTQALVDGLLGGTQLPQLVRSLLHDPLLLAPARTLQSGLWDMGMPLLLGYALLALAWHVIGERSPWQASPGKHALGLQVTDLQGRRLSLARALLRHVAGVLSWLSLNLGHALALLPPQKRALHDYIAGARVVRR